MIVVAEVVLWTLAVLVLLPMAVLVAESLAALLPGRRRAAADPNAPRQTCVVLIPAYNEKAGIAATLDSLRPQLGPKDRILVVAHNCTDNTADIARDHGAAVIERGDDDPNRRKKCYALDYGVRELDKDPPEVVVIVDADCIVHGGALDRLVRAASGGRPVQAAYVLHEPPQARPTQRLSAFAFKFKNVVRPLGLARFGAPCLLTGSGMAFPWPVLRDADLTSGGIVEDMKVGIDLALAGHPPQFCPEAEVTSELPSSKEAATKQRERWEHGHLAMLKQVPRLLAAGVFRARPHLLGLALELSVPPLSLLFLLWALFLAGAVAFWHWADDPLPAVALLCGALAVGLGIFAAWAKFGRERLPLTTLLATPVYILWKVPIYLKAILGRMTTTFIRTKRSAEGAGPQPSKSG
jgi:cellulose synthase/poly-beta-1,6-N-acetylglucosamine synthase-like glycosyltransferase